MKSGIGEFRGRSLQGKGGKFEHITLISCYTLWLVHMSCLSAYTGEINVEVLVTVTFEDFKRGVGFCTFI